MVFEKPRRHYKLNSIALVLVLVVAYIAFGYVTQSLPEPLKAWLGVKTPAEQRAVTFAQNYSDRLISYTDPLYGFKVNYPVGYAIESQPDYGVQLRVLAIVPGFSAEIMDVYVSNTSFSEQDFREIVEQANKSQLQLAGKKIINGREIYLVNLRGESEFTDEILFIRQAFYNCRTPEGQAYSAGIVFVVPEVVAADVGLADYIIASFEC